MTQEELNTHLEGLLHQVKNLRIRAQEVRKEIREYINFLEDVGK